MAASFVPGRGKVSPETGLGHSEGSESWASSLRLTNLALIQTLRVFNPNFLYGSSYFYLCHTVHNHWCLWKGGIITTGTIQPSPCSPTSFRWKLFLPPPIPSLGFRARHPCLFALLTHLHVSLHRLTKSTSLVLPSFSDVCARIKRPARQWRARERGRKTWLVNWVRGAIPVIAKRVSQGSCVIDPNRKMMTTMWERVRRRRFATFSAGVIGTLDWNKKEHKRGDRGEEDEENGTWRRKYGELQNPCTMLTPMKTSRQSV